MYNLISHVSFKLGTCMRVTVNGKESKKNVDQIFLTNFNYLPNQLNYL